MNERAMKTDGHTQVTLTRPDASAARVRDVVGTVWCLFRGLQDDPLSAEQLVQFARSGLSASSEPIEVRLAANCGVRMAHYAIILAWDTYAALVDDYAYYVEVFQEARRRAKLGKRLDERAIRKEIDRPRGTPLELIRRMGLNVLDEAATERTSRWDAWVKSVKALRDHLAHGAGYIDLELDHRSCFTVSWIRGLGLEQIASDEYLDNPQVDESATESLLIEVDPDVRRKWFNPSLPQVEGILASIAHLAMATCLEFIERHASNIIEV